MKGTERTYRMLPFTVIAIAFALTWSACDSDGDGDVDDADRVVGLWALSALTDSVGDQYATFQANFTSFNATFTGTGNVTIMLNSADADPDINLSGTWTLDEANGAVNITTTVGSTPVTLPFGYSFSDSNTLLLSTNAVVLNQVLSTTLTGLATATLTRQPQPTAI